MAAINKALALPTKLKLSEPKQMGLFGKVARRPAAISVRVELF